MPVFEIEQYELHVVKYRVKAANETKAIQKLFEGYEDALASEYVEVAEDYGMPAEEHPDLAKKLDITGAVIPSIRSIVKAKEKKNDILFKGEK